MLQIIHEYISTRNWMYGRKLLRIARRYGPEAECKIGSINLYGKAAEVVNKWIVQYSHMLLEMFE